MKRLELAISQIQGASIKVFTDQHGDYDSVIPYAGAQQTTILKALNAEDFQSRDFSLAEKKWMVEQELLTSNSRRFNPHMLENIGEELYRTLFPEPGSSPGQEKVLTTLRGLTYDNTGLHIQIKITGDVGKHRLSDYPWELLWNDRGFLAENGIYLSRYIAIENSAPHLPLSKGINVLLVSSRASDPENGLKPLSDEERRAVHEGLQKAREENAVNTRDNENIYLEELPPPVTFKKLRDYLTEHRGMDTPHFIHFDGHGHFGFLCQNNLSDNRKCKTFNPGLSKKCRVCHSPIDDHLGYLLFEDDQGNPDYVSAKDFASALGNANRSNKDDHGITVVILSACKSSMALAENSVFNGIAQRLIYHRIPAVVGMAFTVNADSTRDFTEQFYRSIRQKLPLVQAVSSGRQAMRFDGNQWYRPVLYMRWQDDNGGQIFAKRLESDQATRETQSIKEDQAKNEKSRTRMNHGNLKLLPKAILSADKMQKPPTFVWESAIAYYEEIKVKQIQLIAVYLLFGLFTEEDIPPEHYELVTQSLIYGIEDIFPEHCDLAILPLQDIAQPLQNFYDLIKDALNRERTTEVVQLQSSLMIPLRSSCELIRKLISLISDYKEICQTSADDMIEQRREIQTDLETLREKLCQISKNMDSYSNSI
jgi:hypothetical protein